ncbi:MAG: hypothetical protein ACOH2M_09725 [Cypionkella sp.]
MKQQYRVRAGMRFGNRKQHGPGDVVELTAEEALGFLDKLELVDVILPALNVAPGVAGDEAGKGKKG